MKRYHADECCKSGWEDAEFYLCSDVDRRAPDPTVELLREAREALEEMARTMRGYLMDEHDAGVAEMVEEADALLSRLDAALRGEPEPAYGAAQTEAQGR